MDANLNGALAMVSSSGSLRPRHQGTIFLGYFLWGEQQEVTRHEGEINTQKSMLNYQIYSKSGQTQLDSQNHSAIIPAPLKNL